MKTVLKDYIKAIGMKNVNIDNVLDVIAYVV